MIVNKVHFFISDVICYIIFGTIVIKLVFLRKINVVNYTDEDITQYALLSLSRASVLESYGLSGRES